MLIKYKLTGPLMSSTNCNFKINCSRQCGTGISGPSKAKLLKTEHLKKFRLNYEVVQTS